MSYRHTQIGTWTVAAVGGVVLLMLGVTLFVEVDPPIVILAPIGLALFLALLLVAFASLTVEVTREQVVARFGPGWIRKRFDVANIRSADPVRNRWYWGWGIRLTPHGWLYNVSGLEAVELELDNGKRVRIGTDEPQALARAVREAAGIGEGRSSSS